MNRWMRRAIATVALLMGFALPASATSTGIDYTDQWWGGQNESGWGVNFIEQGTTIFATLFVYGSDGTPRWFVSTMESGGTTAFSGDLYSTTGTYYGTNPFNPNIGVTKVGTMAVNFVSAYGGSLQYVVNGVTVNKTVVRQSFRNNNIAGSYMGGMAATGSNCHNGVTNGAAFINGGLVVTQNGQNVSMAVSFFNGGGLPTVCTYSGVLAAQGVLGQIANGTFSCLVNNGSGNSQSNAGNFNLDNMTMTQDGFSGVFTGSDQYCTYNGWFGGVKAPM
jgi:hypothetical protein